MTPQELKEYINANITTNGKGEISGEKLNEILNGIVEALENSSDDKVILSFEINTSAGKTPDVDTTYFQGSLADFISQKKPRINNQLITAQEFVQVFSKITHLQISGGDRDDNYMFTTDVSYKSSSVEQSEDSGDAIGGLYYSENDVLSAFIMVNYNAGRDILSVYAT